MKPEMAFVCLDFESTFSWNPASHLGLDLCNNATLHVPALKTSGAMELGYSLQAEESAFHVALSSHPFPTGITQCELSVCLCLYLPLVAQFQHTAMYPLIIYILLASYLVPQLPSQTYWETWIRGSL